ncbi:MAG: hypothetical protein H6R01_917 [Burkholderiaceae bacterium]|nr:hypothetical protein [Burkholderiaceae bacterium]
MNATNNVTTMRDSMRERYIDYVFRICGRKAYFTIKDLARILGYTEQYVRNKLSQEAFPIEKCEQTISKHPRFFIDDIVNLLLRWHYGAQEIASKPRRGRPPKAAAVAEEIARQWGAS